MPFSKSLPRLQPVMIQHCRRRGPDGGRVCDDASSFRFSAAPPHGRSLRGRRREDQSDVWAPSSASPRMIPKCAPSSRLSIKDCVSLGGSMGAISRSTIGLAQATSQRRSIVKEVADLRPDVIFATSTPITVAFHQETLTIPVVFVVVSDPVGAGLVANLPRPGGNITGFLNVEASMGGKWVELLDEVAPGLRRAVMIFNPDTAPGNEAYFTRAFEDAAKLFGLEPVLAPVHADSDMRDVISNLGQEPRGGLVTVTDSFMFVHRATVIAQAARHRVPAVYPNRVSARDGGLLSYGASNIDLFRRAALYVDRILRSKKPSELPVEIPTKFELRPPKRSASPCLPRCLPAPMSDRINGHVRSWHF